jgi:hypothetical protein
LGRLFGPGTGAVWEALGKEAALFGSKLESRGILEPMPMLDSWDAWVRRADPASHNPPAASSAAMARNRCFGFIVFCFLIQGDDSFTFAHGIVRGFPEVGFRFGTKAENSGAKRQRAGMNLIPSQRKTKLMILLKRLPRGHEPQRCSRGSHSVKEPLKGSDLIYLNTSSIFRACEAVSAPSFALEPLPARLGSGSVN